MFSGIFEMFNTNTRRLRNGNKLSLILEMRDDLDTEIKLLDYRWKDCKVFLKMQPNEKNKRGEQQIDGVFNVFDVKTRNLKNGNKLRVILEELYNKDHEIKAVTMKFNEVSIDMELIQPEVIKKEKENAKT